MEELIGHRDRLWFHCKCGKDVSIASATDAEEADLPLPSWQDSAPIETHLVSVHDVDLAGVDIHFKLTGEVLLYTNYENRITTTNLWYEIGPHR